MKILGNHTTRLLLSTKTLCFNAAAEHEESYAY